MKGFSIGRFLATAVGVLIIVALASRIAPVRKIVFNTQA